MIKAMAADPMLIVEKLVLDKASQAYATMTDRSSVGHGLVVASSLFALAGLGFMIFAAHLWLARHYQPDLAAAITGAIALGVSLLIALIAAAIVYFRRNVIIRMQIQARKSIYEVFQAIDESLADPAREHPKTVALAAALAGFFVGERHL